MPARFHLDLPARAIFTLPDAAGIGIACRRGSVWVTVDHDLRDIVLEPGERFDGTTHRRALVWAFESSCITVSGAQPAAVRVAPRPQRSPWRLDLHGLSPA